MLDICVIGIYFRQSKLSQILTAILEQSLISEQDSESGEKVTKELHKSEKERKGDGSGRDKEAYLDR